MKNLKPRTKLILVFVAGLILGAVIANAFCGPGRPPTPMAMRKHILRKLSGDLDLSNSQKDSLDGTIRNMQSEFIDFKLSHKDEVMAIMEKALADAKKNLTPEQQTKLDKVYQEKIQKKWTEQLKKENLDK